MAIATVNIVPRNDNEGMLGTEGKKWSKVHAYSVEINGKQAATLEDCNQTENYLKRDTEYQKGAIATSLLLPTWAYFECTLAGTTSVDAVSLAVTAIGQKIEDGTAEWVVRHKQDGHNVGDIWMFKGTFSSDGFPVHVVTGLPMLDCHICDGTNGTINMIDKFAMGANKTGIGGAGGANSRVLSIAQIPAHAHGASAWTDAQGYHAHNFNGNFVAVNSSVTQGAGIHANNMAGWTQSGRITADGNHGHNVGVSVANAGSGQAFDNRPAYVALAFVQKIY